MTTTTLPRKSGYRSPLREEQAARTRERIEQAAVALLNATENPEEITYKAVAKRAGVTEMTVYRHFPTREDLLRGLWRQLNASMGPGIGMPASIDDLLEQHGALFAGFDQVAPAIQASITTPQGREMRAALNDKRRRAFRSIVDEVAPDLAPAARTRAAAVLQLLHSAHAWMSLRDQWGLDGREAGAATRWAIDILLQNLRRGS
jgi:AcrR family transcriptional regulator